MPLKDPTMLKNKSLRQLLASWKRTKLPTKRPLNQVSLTIAQIQSLQSRAINTTLTPKSKKDLYRASTINRHKAKWINNKATLIIKGLFRIINRWVMQTSWLRLTRLSLNIRSLTKINTRSLATWWDDQFIAGRKKDLFRNRPLHSRIDLKSPIQNLVWIGKFR